MFESIDNRPQPENPMLEGYQLKYLSTGEQGDSRPGGLEETIESKTSELANRLTALIEDLALLREANFIDDDDIHVEWLKVCNRDNSGNESGYIRNQVFSPPLLLKGNRNELDAIQFGIQLGHLARLFAPTDREAAIEHESPYLKGTEYIRNEPNRIRFGDQKDFIAWGFLLGIDCQFWNLPQELAQSIDKDSIGRNSTLFEQLHSPGEENIKKLRLERERARKRIEPVSDYLTEKHQLAAESLSEFGLPTHEPVLEDLVDEVTEHDTHRRFHEQFSAEQIVEQFGEAPRTIKFDQDIEIQFDKDQLSDQIDIEQIADQYEKTPTVLYGRNEIFLEFDQDQITEQFVIEEITILLEEDVVVVQYDEDRLISDTDKETYVEVLKNRRSEFEDQTRKGRAMAAQIETEKHQLFERKGGGLDAPIRAFDVFRAVSVLQKPVVEEIKSEINEHRTSKAKERPIRVLLRRLDGTGENPGIWEEFPLIREVPGGFEPTSYGGFVSQILIPESKHRESDKYLPTELDISSPEDPSFDELLEACYAFAFGKPNPERQQTFNEVYLERLKPHRP